MFCCGRLCSVSAAYTVQSDEKFAITKTPDQQEAPPTAPPVDSSGGIAAEEPGARETPQETTADRDVDVDDDADDRKSSIDSVTSSTLSIQRHSKRVGFISKPIGDVDKTIVKYPKSQNEINLIKNAIASSEFLGNVVNESCVDEIIAAMHLKEFRRPPSGDDDADAVIIEQGDDGTFLCVSAGGAFDVYVDGVHVNRFDNYRVFGEHAILYNTKRNATVKCHWPETSVDDATCRVWILDADVYQRINIRNAIEERDELMRFIRRVPALGSATEAHLTQAANLFARRFYPMNETIVREGDVGDRFYVIRAGSVTVTKTHEGAIGTLTKGQFFGERALLSATDRRAATVVADAPGCECLTLDRDDFLRHFGNVDAFINRASSISTPAATVEGRRRRSHADVALADLKIVATLGVGGFGRVEFVRHRRDPRRVFALKYLRKRDVVAQQQERHVLNERRVQTDCYACAFVVKLYRTYCDERYLYFLMEACLGGDLYGLIRRQRARRFRDADAQFYAACAVEALDYLHRRDYVYRDLKPENLLVDARGYAKLADFGFAKRVDSASGRTYTFAGTPEYVAPEIIANRGHGKPVDNWALGVLIYELLTGRTPFKGGKDELTNNVAIYNRIAMGIENARFPTDAISREARSLIVRLCRAVPAARLGCQLDGADAVRRHAWFGGSAEWWSKLRARTLRAPHVPKLKGHDDLRNFERFAKDDVVPESVVTDCDEEF